LASAARTLSRERYLGNTVAGFSCFLRRARIDDLGSTRGKGAPMGRAFHIVQDTAANDLLVQPTVGGGVLEDIRDRLLAGRPKACSGRQKEQDIDDAPHEQKISGVLICLETKSTKDPIV
jgi:hypothetical protein